MMIALLPQRQEKPGAYQPTQSRKIKLKMSLPYFQTSMGRYIHRVRDAYIDVWDGESRKIVVHMWCGMSGFTAGKRTRNGRLMAAPAEHDVVCATCEGRAIGSGLFGSPQIAGHIVRFSPRV